MTFSIFPYLLILFLLVVALWVIKAYLAGYKKTSVALFVVFLIIFAGGIRTVNSPEPVRESYEKQSFDRWHKPTEKFIDDARSFEERMEDKHQDLRDESEQLFNRYQGENNDEEINH